MKKIYLVCALVFFSITITSSFALTPAEACKNLQNRVINNLDNIKNCSNKSSYGINPAYLFKGMENGKCHYSKVKFESGLKMNILAECYAPISAIQNFASDIIRETREMCDANGISATGYIAKENASSLERYCNNSK